MALLALVAGATISAAPTGAASSSPPTGAASSSAPAGAAPSLPAPFIAGAYQHVPLGIAADTPRIARVPWPSAGTLTWAFATGECGSERWGDFDTEAFARINVADFVRSGRRYVVSTGGEAGIFSCAGAAGMRRFVARYDSPQLAGIDFDIEGRQTPQQITDLVNAAAAVQRERPALRWSFTLATHAAGDGSRRSLNATGERVLEAIRVARLDGAIVNLMAMNYGPADARWCVLREGATPAACDMGRSAVQAAENVHARYRLPYHRIALTAMLGENDVAGNVFTPADARVLLQGAHRLGLAGVHYWSLARDQPCPPGSARVSPACHGLPGVDAGAFGRLLDEPKP